jgi:hypothetical protein
MIFRDPKQKNGGRVHDIAAKLRPNFVEGCQNTIAHWAAQNRSNAQENGRKNASEPSNEHNTEQCTENFRTLMSEGGVKAGGAESSCTYGDYL